MSSPHLSAFSAVFAALVSSTAALAQSRDPSAAEALFRSAREAMARGDFANACTRFAESYRLDPAPGTLLNVADCEEKQGKVASSFTHFSEALEGLPKDDFRVAYAHERLRALEPRLPMLTVTVASDSAGASITRDEVELRAGSFGIPLPVDPGTHVLAVHLEGRADTRQEVTVVVGQHVTIELHAGSPTRVTASTTSEAPTYEPSRAYPIAAFAIGGAGIATGIVTGLVFKSAVDTYRQRCDRTGCEADGMSAASRARTMNVVSPIAFGIGAIGIATETYLLLTSKHEAPRRAGLAVEPYVAPSLAGLSLSGGF
jgi:hypothetical protein